MATILSRSARRLVSVVCPEFTISRNIRRFNMAEEDRAKFFNWNLASIVLTSIPFAYMILVNYDTSEDTEKIYRTLDPMREVVARPNVKLFTP